MTLPIKYNTTISIETRVTGFLNGVSQATFTDLYADLQAKVCTLRGVKVFDSTNTETNATHKFILDYVAGVTYENFVNVSGKRFRILNVENCCEQGNVLKLMCSERGSDGEVINEG